MAQTVGPPMAMFPAGVHGVSQQLFYGQQTSTLLTHDTRAELTFPDASRPCKLAKVDFHFLIFLYMMCVDLRKKRRRILRKILVKNKVDYLSL